MAHGVCPWWIGYLLACPLRRLAQDPVKILEPYVRAGMTVLEPGPGMGFFTLDLARLAGTSGRVVVVDIQPKMLARLRRRLEKAGLLGRTDVRLVQPDTMALHDLTGRVDFVLAFALVHEMPSAEKFFAETARTLRPGGTLLLAEPTGHVNAEQFAAELATAAQAGLTVADRPTIRRSLTALLAKTA
jgi:ubiquinone/menaquinone biosynthesis C-methylase UbiE